MRFDTKRVFVTGGTRGIGLAISQAFASRGARVCMGFCRDTEAAESALATLGGTGHSSSQGDLANTEGMDAVLADAISLLGGLDILVNNAGISVMHEFPDTDFDAWKLAWSQTLDVNLIAPAHLSFCAAKHMAKHGGGRIVNVSSRGAFRGEPDKPAYGASKAGLNALGQSLAQALAPMGIFVGTVAPGFVETELSRTRLEGPDGEGIRAQSPLGRVARPEEVARGVLFLASEGSEFMTGTILDVNGASYLRS